MSRQINGKEAIEEIVAILNQLGTTEVANIYNNVVGGLINFDEHQDILTVEE